MSSSVRELSLLLTRQAITHPLTVSHLTLTRLLISNITQIGISLDAVLARNIAAIDPFRVTAEISHSTLIRLLVSDITQIGTLLGGALVHKSTVVDLTLVAVDMSGRSNSLSMLWKNCQISILTSSAS